jgi:cytochrome c553
MRISIDIAAFLLVAMSVASGAPAAFAQSQPQTQTIEEKAQLCTACHGEKGVPQEKTTPIIWGEHQGYLYLQLRDFKIGMRKNEFMTAVAAGLERDDMMALAEYFSKKVWPDINQPEAPADEALQAQRANSSIGCTGCHLGQYQGDATVPRLAGQNHDYLIKSMRDFRSGARGNNPGMTNLMRATPESALAPLADYLAGK